jgi:hypothetical protein
MAREEKSATVIIVANRPRFYRELLYRALATAPKAFQVFELTDESRLAKAIKDRQADWVIVTSDEDAGLPAAAESLLAAQPALAAIAVSPDGARVEVISAGTNGRTRQDYQNISLAQLIAVLAADSTGVHP